MKESERAPPKLRPATRRIESCFIRFEIVDGTYAGDKFPNHECEIFMRGGEYGTPLSLWDNNKDDIEAILSSGDIELFGMTVSNVTENYPDFDSVYSIYKSWVEMALSYNSETSFFIGAPWLDYPSLLYEDAAEYAEGYDKILTFLEVIVLPLREEYPSNNFFWLAYGPVALKMREMFEEGRLNGINSLIQQRGSSNARTSIFTDEKGHAGTMLLNLSALSWVSLLYGAPMNRLLDGAEKLGWDRADSLEILTEVIRFNQEYFLIESK